MDLSVELRTYRNVGDFLTDVDSQIQRLETYIKELERRKSELEMRIERFKRISEVIRKLTGGSEQQAAESEIEITGLKLYIDPRPIDEYRLVSETLPIMSDRLAVLRKSRELITSILREANLEEVPISVEFRNGVPVKVVIKSW